MSRIEAIRDSDYSLVLSRYLLAAVHLNDGSIALSLRVEVMNGLRGMNGVNRLTQDVISDMINAGPRT